MNNSTSPENKLSLEHEAMSRRMALLERSERLAAHAHDIRFGELPVQPQPSPAPAETRPQTGAVTGVVADRAIQQAAHYDAYEQIASSQQLSEIYRRINEAHAEQEAA